MRACVVRGLTVCALCPLAYTVFVIVWETRPVVATFDDATFDRIEVGMSPPQVEWMLGSNGRPITPPEGWPRTLGEVPGYANGIPFEFEVVTQGNAEPRHFRGAVPPQTKVRWVLWPVSGRHRWIAVGFFSDGSGGSLTVPTVICKRSGESEERPN